MYRLMLVAILALAVLSAGLTTKAAAQEGEKDKAAAKEKAKSKDSETKDDGYKEVVKVQAVYIAGMDYAIWAMVVAVLALLALNAVLLLMLRSEVAKGK